MSRLIARSVCRHRHTKYRNGFVSRRLAAARLRLADWHAVEDAVVAARFWSAEEQLPLDIRLDGADWLIAGLRGREFHHIKRWSPNAPLRDVGRLMFDLAGLENVSL